MCFARATRRLEKKEALGEDVSGRRSIRGAQSGGHQCTPLARHALPLPIPEGPFWVHKGDVPDCSRGQAKVSVAYHECHYN